jgi:peptide chain release factor 1
LAEDESDLGVTLEVDDTSFDHFVVEIVTLASTLTDTAKDGETTMSLGDVIDEFLNQHGLAHTGTSEQTDFSATSVWSEKVNDLDTSFEHLSGCRLVNERRGVSVNRAEFDTLDGTTFVNGFANDVHDAAESASADGDKNGSARIDDFLTTNETLCTIHGDGANGVLSQMGRNLKDEATTMEILDLKGVEDGGKVFGVELHVDDGTNDSFH